MLVPDLISRSLNLYIFVTVVNTMIENCIQKNKDASTGFIYFCVSQKENRYINRKPINRSKTTQPRRFYVRLMIL